MKSVCYRKISISIKSGGKYAGPCTNGIKIVHINLILVQGLSIFSCFPFKFKIQLGYVTRCARLDGTLQKGVRKGSNKSALKDS